MSKRIVSNPKILSGEPCFEGTRISASLIEQLLHPVSERTFEDIIEMYPSLTREDLYSFSEQLREKRRGELYLIVKDEEARRRQRRDADVLRIADEYKAERKVQRRAAWRRLLGGH